MLSVVREELIDRTSVVVSGGGGIPRGAVHFQDISHVYKRLCPLQGW